MAEDIGERPACECHGLPMRSNGRKGWECGVRVRARQNRWLRTHPKSGQDRNRRMRSLYRRRKDAGVCTHCGGPLLSESLCWDCLNRLEERRGISF